MLEYLVLGSTSAQHLALTLKLIKNLKYMAPEVSNSRKCDTKADIYSLGVIEDLFNLNPDM